MGLADKIRENHELAATTQQALRNGRRVIRRIADETPISVPTVVEAQPLPQPVPIPHTAITVSPLDLPAEQFKAGLDRRKANRELLMEWLRSALVEGVDFGRIHVASKERCQFARQGRVKDCGDPHHWSKPSLFKPGAEKITGMLGMTVHYPSLPDYEQAVLNGIALTTVMLRCELRDAHGRPVAEGVGARSVGQDYGDINKTLKMAEKSAHIDATLRLAGLSEIYTQDIEDRPVVEEETPVASLPPKPRRSAKSATPASNATSANSATDATLVQIGKEALETLRQEIRQYGFTEKRVLAWLYKTTGGSVTKLDQLTQAQCASISKRLETWAEGEKTFANGQAQQEGGSHE
ncbi:hypothetical protein [Dechloromonas sp. ZS-1]|uniref:hypothetical protein n=1 Tax=Dechloromonas sp. ZS-1 TaxID=3138067 RepID=UPI0031FD5C80